MTCRRIVTGHDASGAAVFVDDSEVQPVELNAIPGFQTHELWSTDGERKIPLQSGLREVLSYFPGRDGTVFRQIVFPPTVGADAGIDLSPNGIEEIVQKLPGALEHFELEEAGMHTTDSVDYGVVVDGEIYLELDKGKEVLLRKGDCVIQNGTRHAWRNRSGSPATMCFILLGANRLNTES